MTGIWICFFCYRCQKNIPCETEVAVVFYWVVVFALAGWASSYGLKQTFKMEDVLAIGDAVVVFLFAFLAIDISIVV